VLPESRRRFYSMLSLRFRRSEQSLRQVEDLGDRKHVGGFMVTTVAPTWRSTTRTYMKGHRAIEERGLVLSFHSGPNWGERSSRAATASSRCMRSAFRWYNVRIYQLGDQRHGEGFPKRPVI